MQTEERGLGVNSAQSDMERVNIAHLVIDRGTKMVSQKALRELVQGLARNCIGSNFDVTISLDFPKATKIISQADLVRIETIPDEQKRNEAIDIEAARMWVAEKITISSSLRDGRSALENLVRVYPVTPQN